MLPGPVHGQQTREREATEERLRALEQQIERDRRQLDRATSEERASVQSLRELDREIALREELARNYRRRLRQISLQHDSLRTSLASLEMEMSILKAQYQQRAAHAYRYGRLHDLALILSARSINQMLIRGRYLHRFSDQRRRRLNQIQQIGTLLRQRRDLLAEMRARNEVLLRDTQQQEVDLTRLQRDRSRMIARLRRQRTDLERDLKRKQAAASDLQNRIRRFVASETNERRRRASTNAASEANFARLTGSFRQNQGRLPWPVSGTIIEPFGNRINPELGTTTANPGVLIATDAGAEVRAVFEGEVLMIEQMPEFGRLVTLSHGDYKTLYANLSSVSVSRGQKVKAGQVVGRAGSGAEPKGRGLFFGVFKNGQAINPASWLQSR